MKLNIENLQLNIESRDFCKSANIEVKRTRFDLFKTRLKEEQERFPTVFKSSQTASIGSQSGMFDGIHHFRYSVDDFRYRV